MSKKQKLLEKIQNGLHNATMDDILGLMSHRGFQARKSAHGYIFFHQKIQSRAMPHVAEPHGKENKVKAKYVKECLEAIELLNEMEDEE